MKASIVLCPGDGIGGEVLAEARAVLEDVAQRFGHAFTFTEHPIGGVAIDQTGQPLPEATLAACRAADAVLLGAVGGPRWDDPALKVRPEQGLLGLRRALGLYANLRPILAYRPLASVSPLKGDRLTDVNILFIRELTGGIYFGEPRRREERGGRVTAVDTMVYTDEEIRRVVRLAFRLSQGRRRHVTSIDKANVLETSRLWRQIVLEVARDFPDVRLDHQLVDSASMRIITQPQHYDVVVTENLFGDILTDESAVLSGALGLLPSASLGEGTLGLYEPVHGSAPDIAGRGVANPIGAILSAAMLLRHSLGLETCARAIEAAVALAIEAGARTTDLGGQLGTREMGAAVRARLEHAEDEDRQRHTAADLMRYLEYACRS
jgi:3-isopropylmalate dehydrogenase